MTCMATPSKRKSSPKSSQPPGRPSRSPASSSGPFLRFHHSEALRKKSLALLGKIEKARDATEHSDALADLIVELTKTGFDTYFLKSLGLANPGFVVEQSARLGMKGVQKVIASAIRQVISRMDSPQLLSVCSSIRRFMR